MLHLGRNNPRHWDKLEANQLESSFAGKDLGIMIDKMVTKSQQCDLMAKKINSILGCMRKTVKSRPKEVIVVVPKLGGHLSPSLELAYRPSLHLY